MNEFMMGVYSLEEKELHTEMFLNDMDISRLMVYVQQIEEIKIREIRQEGKRPRSDEQRYYPNIKAKVKEVNQAPSGGPDPNFPRNNRYYVIGTE